MSLLGKMLLGMLIICMPEQVFGWDWDWRTKVSITVNDQPLEMVCSILEKQYGIHFSYSRNVVDLSRLVTVNVHNKPLKRTLEDIFDPFDIQFTRMGEQIILTVKNRLMYTVSGYVQDIQTGERLIGATIYSPSRNAGTTTNQFGFFSLTLPLDTNALQVSYVGYDLYRLPVTENSKMEVIVSLQPWNNLAEVIISDSSIQRTQEQENMNRLSILPSDVKAMPRLLGEADVMRTLVALPGVSGGIDGGGLNVRGGSADQNMVLLDGTPIFNVSHLFGIFSVFNPDIVKNAAFYKGGFPARYGGRLSSVVDIALKDGDMQEFHGEAAIGLIAAKAMMEGPLKKGKTSFVISARRSFTDLLMDNLLIDNNNGGVQSKAYVYFYDANVKVNHIFSPKDRLYLSAYTGKDMLTLRREDKPVDASSRYYGKSRSNLSWGNHAATLRWNHIFNPKLFANVTTNYSQYFFSTDYTYDYKPVSITDTSRLYGKYYSRMQNIIGKIDLEYRPDPEHTIKFGGGTITHLFNPGVSVFEDKGQGQPVVDTAYNDVASVGQEIFLYAEDEWKAGKSLWLNAGVHLSGFLVDNKFYHSLQPRLGARYQLPRNWALKFSYTHMTQYLHLLANNEASLPTDLWVPSTGNVRPMFSRQVSAGISKRSKNNMFGLSFETYFKTMEHVIEYKEYGSPFTGAGEHWDENVIEGKGQSYGGELLLEKRKGATHGWIGYTLSWSNRTFPGVNNGKSFPYRYDRRHDFEIVLTQRLGKRWELSASWEYTTGLPFTLPTASYEGIDDASPYDRPAHDPILDHAGNRNQYRTQNVHRLDISATYSKKMRLWTKSWTFSLYNAYNKQNPFFYTIVTDWEKQERYLSEISILPILPSVTYAIKF
jgi:hypothetical protein